MNRSLLKFVFTVFFYYSNNKEDAQKTSNNRGIARCTGSYLTGVI